MTFYTIHFRDGTTYDLSFVENLKRFTGEERWTEVRRLARKATGNKNGVEKIVRKMTGETVWETKINRQPHKKTQ